MKVIILIVIGLFTLTGCQTNGGNLKNRISFEMDNQYWPKHSIVYKNNWPECGNLTLTPEAIKKQKYITTYSSCKVSPEGYVPQQITIEYAPWLTYEEQQKISELRAKETFLYRKKISPDTGNLVEEMIGRDEAAIEYNGTVLRKNVQAAIDKLPPSTWKRIVLTPPQEVEKYKYQIPEGNGNRSRGKNIHYIISLKPDGSYSIETKLYWTEPYQKNWN
ncbi:hypothetical protein [Acinetobacter pittii]|uniref:hypothetical protein n=1 Tax=Acinetobacter pittii TaxID=48296 RepID=UPI000B35BD74|nr:hypothetical protein [Acinetobacter pittii]